MNMQLDIQDIITLNDGNEYQIVSKTEHEGLTYYYLVDMNDLENVKFVFENGNKLTEIDEPEVINDLMSKLFEEIKDKF